MFFQHRETCGTTICETVLDRKSTRLNSSHLVISYAVFCLKKKNICNAINCDCFTTEIKVLPIVVDYSLDAGCCDDSQHAKGEIPQDFALDYNMFRLVEQAC